MIEIAIILAIGILMTLLLLMLLPILVFSKQQNDNLINKEYSCEWKKIHNSLTKLEKSIKENENKKN